MSAWPGSDHHRPCPCGAELDDECARCNRINPLGSMRIEPAIGSAEYGRRLASERDDLIASGIDPTLLAVPLHPSEVES